jgi:hypothetical protein
VSGKNAAHLRKLAADMSDKGMRCWYCGVPTAATIEHVHPQAKGGLSRFRENNLVLACNYCNTRKNTMPVEEFIKSGRWRLDHPPLPSTTQEMLKFFFGWQPGMEYVRTNSPHSRLRLKGDNVLLEVRPGRNYPWEVINLGTGDNPKVIAAAYDFLKRHYTPLEPKEIPETHQRLWSERGSVV